MPQDQPGWFQSELGWAIAYIRLGSAAIVILQTKTFTGIAAGGLGLSVSEIAATTLAGHGPQNLTLQDT